MARSATALALAALMMTLSLAAVCPVATAEQRESRLNSLLLKKSSVYLPSRLVIGQDNRFMVKAQPGSTVLLYVSPAPEGYLFEQRLPLHVGEQVEELSGIIPANGILEMTLPLPNDAELDGQMLYVDAVVGKAADHSDYARPELLDATGRRTTENALVINKPADRGHTLVTPTIPGLDPQMINQITQTSEIVGSGDERRKQLLMNGEINRDAAIDQNAFNRRGMMPGVK